MHYTDFDALMRRHRQLLNEYRSIWHDIRNMQNEINNYTADARTRAILQIQELRDKHILSNGGSNKKMYSSFRELNGEKHLPLMSLHQLTTQST